MEYKLTTSTLEMSAQCRNPGKFDEQAFRGRQKTL